MVSFIYGRLPSAKPFVLAQRYVSNPLLINNCKFGLRLWLLVTGVDPFTAYLHNQGLVLFSTDRWGCPYCSTGAYLMLSSLMQIVLLDCTLGLSPLKHFRCATLLGWISCTHCIAS